MFHVKQFFLAVLLFGLACGEARAGHFYVDPSGCRVDPAGASNAIREDLLASGGDTPQTRWKFIAGATREMFCPFTWPHDAPYQDGCTAAGVPWACCTATDTGCEDAPAGIFQVTIKATATATGSHCTRTTVGIAEPNAAPGVYAYGTALALSILRANAASTYVDMSSSSSTLLGVTHSGTDPRGRQMALKIERVQGLGGCANTGAGDEYVEHIAIGYP